MLVLAMLVVVVLSGGGIVSLASGWRPTRLTLQIVGASLLMFSWYCLFTWVVALTEGVLAPWDVTPGRPPVGTWSRTTNDFFEAGPGSFLPAAVLVLGSATLFVRQLRFHAESRWLPWIFAVSNLAFLPVSLMLSTPLALVSNAVVREPGYARSAPLFGLFLLLAAMLLLVQRQLPRVVLPATPSSRHAGGGPVPW